MPLLLLHGAIGASDQLLPLIKLLDPSVKVYTLDFSGHGTSGSKPDDFSIEMFANDVLNFMEQENLPQVSVFGYSMGGYVAMYLARHYPHKINKVISLAAKFRWDPEGAAKEIQLLQPDKIESKIPAFAAVLQKRHQAHNWKDVLRKTAAMMERLGVYNALDIEDIKNINAPCLLLLGDKDKMVTLDETVKVFQHLPNGQLGVLPATTHPIELVNLELLAMLINRFIA
jgi:pimeloyl-ACP methyl ester carboxylesterase